MPTVEWMPEQRLWNADELGTCLPQPVLEVSLCMPPRRHAFVHPVDASEGILARHPASRIDERIVELRTLEDARPALPQPVCPHSPTGFSHAQPFHSPNPFPLHT